MALALAALSCGQKPIGADLSVRAVFTAGPSVGCVSISAAGATRTVSQSFAAVSGTSPSFVLRQVPTGDVLISGSAYDAPCGDLISRHPTWVAGQVLQTLAPGVSATLALSFLPNGEATVTAQFDGVPAAPDASCLRLSAVGATRTVERSLDLGAPAFAVSELPVGDVLFIADAFPSPCVSVTGGSVGTWHADPVRAALTAGTPIDLAFDLHPVAPGIAVFTSPAFALADAGGTIPFRAAVNGTSGGQSSSVTWSVAEGAAGGTVDGTGLYTAPAAAGTYHVVATSVADPSKSSASAVRVAPGSVFTADRRTIWNPGMMAVGGIPSRSTICARVNAFAYGDGAADASAAIQAAIDGCPPGQVEQLSAGTFTVNDFVLLDKGITLRGAGAGATLLQKTNGAHINDFNAPDFQPIAVVGPNRFPRFDDTSSQNLAADGSKGAYSVTVQDGSRFAPGQFVLLDELSGASWQVDRLGRGMIWASPDYRVVWQLHDPPVSFDDPLIAITPTSGDAASWFSRQDRVTAEVKEVASVDGNVVTFSTPLHIDYRVSHAAQLTPTDAANIHVTGAGLESFTVTGASDGAIRFENAAYSWLRGVEITLWIGEGVAVDKSFRIEVRDSYVHDAAWAQPGGAGYAISLAAGSAEALFENNISIRANKVMVARCAGAGSVFGYNYVDDGYINTIEGWIEIGLNASHMVGPHHVLFEGNYGFNWDSDHTHGNSTYHTVFRNHLRGIRRPFVNPLTGDLVDDATQAAGPRRCIGATGYSYWMTFLGNVLGAEGAMGNFTYDVTGILGMNAPAIWLLGWDDVSPQPYDPLTAQTAVRHGNFDYLTHTVVWDPASNDQTLPDSLYLSRKPAFFDAGSGYGWPWVDPVGPTKLRTLPAKARYDAGTPFTQP